MTLFYPLAHERIAVCSGVADDLSRLSGIKRERFKVIFNPAAGGWTGEAPRPMISLPHYDVLILSVGSLKKQKDHETLIRAFALLGDQRNAHLVILGEGNERKRLESLVATLRLEGRVHMPGFAIDARPYYDAADLFVLSSRYEGFGNVIVEALERGVPVVSTRCPHGPQEILDNGTFGRLVPVGDPRALADAIDGALRADHDKSALKHRASIFDVNRIASQYLSLMFPGKDTKA
jgi:glycosyltransferase involved in cell wall biosynthesis